MYEKYAELRDSKEITDYRVASDTGITKSYVYRLENREKQAESKKTKSLSRLLRCIS